MIHSSNELYGADRMLLRVIDALGDMAEVEVLLPDDIGYSDSPLVRELEARAVANRVAPIPILRRSHRSIQGLVQLARRSALFWQICRRARPQVVWCANSATLLAAPIARFAGVGRVVLHMQEIWRGADKTILGPLARWCTDIVAISQSSANSLPEQVAKRARVVENATADVGPPAPPAADGPVRFLVASRWNGWKGHKTLLKAWASAGEPGLLVVAGGRPPVGESVDVPALVADMRLENSVEIVGESTDIAELLLGVHYAIVPSDLPEPFGLVAIEAFARARPVIASSEGGLGEIVSHGSDGYLFRNGDDNALSKLLQHASARAAATMGEVAYSTYLRRFTIARFNTELRDFFDGVREQEA